MTQTKRDVIGQEIMHSFAQDIGKIIGEEAILTIDMFSVSFYLQEKTVTYNYGRPIYIDHILPGFLKEKGSIGLIDCTIDRGEEISGNRKSKLKKEPLKYQTSEGFDFAGKCDFEDYLSYLSEKGFGSFCLWVNDFIRYKEAKTNVSVLIVLDKVPDEHELDKLRFLAYKKLFTKGFVITVEEFITKYEEVSDQERILKALEADKQHFGHTIQNIFPQGITNVTEGLELIGEENPARKKLETAKKDLIMSKVIFQSISGQNTPELDNKSILYFLVFLREHTTSKHKIELELALAKSYTQITVERKDIGNVLLLLWNFFHNATKYSGNQTAEDIRTITIKAFDDDGKLVILFRNLGTNFIKLKTKEFLKGSLENPDPADDKGGKGGLEIAKRRLKMLGWGIDFPDEQEKIVEVNSVYGVDMEVSYYYTSVLLTTNITRI